MLTIYLGYVYPIVEKYINMNKKKRVKKLPSTEELELSRLVALGEDPIKAAKTVYGNKDKSPEEIKSLVKEKFTKKEVVANVVKVCDEMEAIGLTVKKAAVKHLHILNKPTSKGTEVLKAVEMVYSEYGKKHKDKEEKVNPLLILIQNRIDRGLPVPKDVMEVIDVSPVKQ